MKRINWFWLLLTALFAVLLFAAPTSAQVSPAQWDSLRDATAALPRNLQIREQRQLILDLIARYRLIVCVCDTVPEPPPPPPPADTSAVAVLVSPASGPSILPGDTTRFLAAVTDSAGQPREWAVTWSSSQAAVATVSASGLATGVAPGLAHIKATTANGVADSVVLEVRAPPVTPPPSEWDSVLVGSYSGNVVVRAGERWLVGANVRVAGNVLVQDAVLGMRPGSALTIVGANPASYVGGGMHYSSTFNNDRGVWVWGTGELDIACTPKVAWNRTGTDPSWEPDDEYWITPTNNGDDTPRRWSPGQPIPRVRADLPAAEVANVTRDCRITGPGHIHVNSSRPQRIEYVRLDSLGVINGGASTGRYALHLHMSGEGSRGTVVRGVAAVNSRGRVFVPHTSHGTTWVDNVSVNSWAEGFWWDVGDPTDDVFVDRMLVAGVRTPEGVTSSTPTFNAFMLGVGDNMVMQNSVAAGVCCHKLSTGFNWISGGQTNGHNPVWVFDQGNVAHNMTGSGIRFWTNLDPDPPHVVRDFVGYRNGSASAVEAAGIETGAYFNMVSYEDILLVDDKIFHHVSSRPIQFIRNATVHAANEAPFQTGARSLPGGTSFPNAYLHVSDCRLSRNDGNPILVHVHNRANHPWEAWFLRCGLTPQNVQIDVEPELEGTHIILDNGAGVVWDIRVTNGRRVDTRR